jgi:hypothetical protein
MTAAPLPAARREAGDVLVITLLATQAVRFAASVVDGFSTIGQRGDFEPGRLHAGEVLSAFGAAGDGVAIALLALATAVLWWRTTTTGHLAQTGQRDVLVWLLALTALAAVAEAVGASIEASIGGFGTRLVAIVGFEAAYVVAALGTIAAVRGLSSGRSSGIQDDELAGEAGAAVFAVDRKTGAVLAWPSMGEALEQAPLYSVEDDEYEWYLDDGIVLAASANGSDVTLVATPQERPDELLHHLKEHALRRGLALDDEEADEPLAYVDPIMRDNYLEMWPGWLRPLGRIARPRRP